MTRLPVRRKNVATRPARIRRSSAGFGRTRALAALMLVLSGLAIYGAGASPVFGYRTLEVTGERLTPRTSIDAAVGIAEGTNLFLVRSDQLAERIAVLPTVDRADVSIGLPSTIRIRVVERVPLLVWQLGAQRYLVDAKRVAFLELAADAPLPDPSLPIVDDQRSASALGVGSTVDSVDFDAATRLASLRPADLGSAGTGLQVSVTDDRGFLVRVRPAGWTAVFGFYTPSLRTTELIPGQVRLLRSLLAGREAAIDTVILADDKSGTYTVRPGASPTP